MTQPTYKIGRHLVIALLFACMACIAHAQNTLDSIRARGKILVATDINLPPFGYLDEQAQQAGSDIDAAKLLAQDLGVSLEIVPVTGQNRVPYLLSRKADIVMSSFSITEERKKVIAYSDPVGVIPLILSGPTAIEVKTWQDLAGKSVAATRGTTPDQELTRGIREHKVPNVTIVRYEDDASTNTAIITGQQRFLSSPPTIATALKKAHPALDLETKFPIKEYPYGIGLRKNEPQLLEYLNAWVKNNIQNGKLNAIYEKHHGYPLPQEYRP